MGTHAEQPAEGLGLLAQGSSRCWEFSISEHLGGAKGWSAELEGPNVYLVFQLQDLAVVAAALKLLRCRSAHSECNGPTAFLAKDGALRLGRFGQSSMSIEWDDETPDRCFLIVGPRARSVLRLTFQRDDISMLIEALTQVVEDLRENGEPAGPTPPN
jgi:hypothetical protein